jgi:ubiquinone/menaquinone biosynthesis C-methylase UbiE
VSDEDVAGWDAAAGTFDEAADHGLSDRLVRAAWRAVLASALPLPPADVVDVGCGTGSLSVLAAEAGHRVTGFDFSPAMIDQARRKAETAGARVTFVVGDAASPPVPPAAFDAVLVRHVLWAMPDPASAIEAWAALLRPAGRLVLIEGSWHTGAGLTAERTLELLHAAGRHGEVVPLTDPALWGGPIDDERYLIVGRGAA